MKRQVPGPGKVPVDSVLRMSAPLVVSFWMRSLFTFVDTLYASTLGDTSVAAIGLSLPFEFLMIAIWVGLATGLTSNLARAMAAHDHGRVEQYLAASWRMVLAIVPFFALLGAACWLFAGPISPDAGVARQFAIYGSVLIGGSALSTFWSVIPDSVVKAHGDTRATMWAGIWSNVINVALNTLFTFVFHWGIFGIALSTVLGRFGGLAYALRKASAHEAERKREAPRPATRDDPHPYRAILALSFPAALTYGLMATESGILNALLKHLDHATEAIAAYAIQYRVLQFVMMPAIATAVAMLPYTARRFGANDLEGVRRGLRESHIAMFLYLLLAAPVLYVGAPLLAAALSRSPMTRAYATFAVRLVPLACLASLSVFLCRPAFEGLGRGRPGLLIALLRYALLTGPMAWIGIRLAAALGYPGLYGLLLGLIAAAGISSAIFLLWTRRVLRTLHAPVSSAAALAPSEL
jgi:putative MATE family efflux protein